MGTRLACCVPHCRYTRKPETEAEEWICQKHYDAVPRLIRIEYEEARKRAIKADQREADGLEVPESVYTRVLNAFEACKAAAIEAAGGI